MRSGDTEEGRAGEGRKDTAERRADFARETRARIDAAIESPTEALGLALDAHLAFVEEHSAGYRELISGAASQPEVRATMDEERRALLERVLSGLPAEVPRTPSVLLAVTGWEHFIEAAELTWLTDGGLDRPALRCAGYASRC